MANENSFKVGFTEAPIEPVKSVFADGEGAECQFLGTVRGEEGDRPISGIEYSAYRPMADAELERICQRAQREHGPHRVEILHRLGFVPAREPSVLIRVQTKHSSLGFDVCRWYLKEIKAGVPIWKKYVRLET